MDLILNSPNLDDHTRLRELVNFQRSYLLPMISQAGHRMANYAAGRTLSPSYHYHHHQSGLGFSRCLLNINSDHLENVSESIRDALDHALKHAGTVLSFTGERKDTDAFLECFTSILGKMPRNSINHDTYQEPPTHPVYRPEAWIINTEVSYVGRAYPVVYFEEPESPIFHVISQLMEIPLYDRIRAKGGAYGAFALYDSTAGIFSFLTFRDPHTAESLKAYDEVIEEIGEGRFSDAQLDQAIIETIRRLDIPPSPREKGVTALFRTRREQTPKMRKNHRNGILNTSRDDICKVVQKYFYRKEISRVSIVTSDEILKNSETSALNLERIPLIGS